MTRSIRRRLLATGLALAATPSSVPCRRRLEDQVAAICTVPVEQQWVSRIHKALEGPPRWRDRLRVLRKRRQRRLRAGDAPVCGIGQHAHRRRGLRGRSSRQKGRPRLPRTAFLLGSSGKAQAPNFSVFDNYIQEPAYLTGMIAGGISKSGKIGMVGGYPIPGR